MDASFTIYAVDSEENITPDWTPSKQEMSPFINIFSCPDEYKGCAAVLRTFASTGKLSHKFSSLRSENAEIGEENCDIRIVKYITSPESKERKLEGRWLEKFDTVSLQKNYTAWLWITVYVPEGTRAGTYRGTLNISDEQGQSKSINIRLKVFNLSEC
jgi:hypothetical protein